MESRDVVIGKTGNARQQLARRVRLYRLHHHRVTAAEHLDRTAANRIRRGTDQTPEERHEECSTHTLVAHVAHHEDHLARRQQEAIVEITRHVARRTKRSLELQVRYLRESLG